MAIVLIEQKNAIKSWWNLMSVKPAIRRNRKFRFHQVNFWNCLSGFNHPSSYTPWDKFLSHQKTQQSLESWKEVSDDDDDDFDDDFLD